MVDRDMRMRFVKLGEQKDETYIQLSIVSVDLTEQVHNLWTVATVFEVILGETLKFGICSSADRLDRHACGV